MLFDLMLGVIILNVVAPGFRLKPKSNREFYSNQFDHLGKKNWKKND